MIEGVAEIKAELARRIARIDGAAPPRSVAHEVDGIRAVGVLEPIVVRPVPGTDLYEIIAGERRSRAAKLAGLTDVVAMGSNLRLAPARLHGPDRRRPDGQVGHGEPRPPQHPAWCRRRRSDLEPRHQSKAATICVAVVPVASTRRTCSMNSCGLPRRSRRSNCASAAGRTSSRSCPQA